MKYDHVLKNAYREIYNSAEADVERLAAEITEWSKGKMATEEVMISFKQKVKDANDYITAHYGITNALDIGGYEHNGKLCTYVCVNTGRVDLNTSAHAYQIVEG
jgi:hypothetical protein